MAIGMTYQQFWEDDPALARYYQKAHDLKRRQRNQELWIMGLYVYEVLSCFAPVLVANPKKGAKVNLYRDHPFPLSVEEAERQECDAKYEKAMTYMRSRMAANNQRFQSRKSGE